MTRAALPALLVLLVLLPCVPLRADDEPGTVSFDSPEDVKRAMADPDAAVRLAAARAAADLQDGLLTAPLVRLLKDKELPVRRAAVAALAGRVEEKERKEAAAGLAARLAPLGKREEDKEEMLEVVSALHDLAQPSTIKALVDVTVNDDRDVVRARAMAVANVPCADAIERLIQLGSKGRRHLGWGDLLRDALQYATGVRLKGDADAWREWWRDAQDGFDFQAAAKRRAEEREAKRRKAERQEEQRRKREERRRDRGDKGGDGDDGDDGDGSDGDGGG